MKNNKLFTLAAAAAAISLMAFPVSAEEVSLPSADRAGNAITVPEEITKVICMAPSTAQILEDLGLSDRIVGIDNQTPYYVEGMEDAVQFAMQEGDEIVVERGAQWPRILFFSRTLPSKYLEKVQIKNLDFFLFYYIKNYINKVIIFS